MKEAKLAGRKDKYLPTPDDWYPNFRGDRVRCSLLPLTTGRIRVCVWGADDTGLERDFETRKDAEMMYLTLPSPITKQWLRDRGFVPA